MEHIKTVKSLLKDIIAKIYIGSKMIGQIQGRSFKIHRHPFEFRKSPKHKALHLGRGCSVLGSVVISLRYLCVLPKLSVG